METILHVAVLGCITLTVNIIRTNLGMPVSFQYRLTQEYVSSYNQGGSTTRVARWSPRHAGTGSSCGKLASV